MAINIQLKHQAGYFRAALKGTVRLAECREVLRQIVEDAQPSGAPSILLNIQATLCQLSDQDITTLMVSIAVEISSKSPDENSPNLWTI